jgi:hypothetical protein
MDWINLAQDRTSGTLFSSTVHKPSVLMLLPSSGMNLLHLQFSLAGTDLRIQDKYKPLA